jgi:hypothetical protein
MTLLMPDRLSIPLGIVLAVLVGVVLALSLKLADRHHRESDSDTEQRGARDGFSGISVPEAQPEQASSSAAGGAAGPQNKNERPGPTWIELTTLIFSGAVAFAAFVQAIFARRQWTAMRAQHSAMLAQVGLAEKAAEQAEQATEQMRLEQRAWLSIGRARITPLAVGECLRAKVSVGNTGRTPATITARSIVFTPIPNDDISLSELVCRLPNFRREVKTVIAPTDKLLVPVQNSDALIAKLHDAILSGKWTVVLLARVDYTDVMGQSRFTQAFFRYEVGSKRLISHPEHNYMT